jgi:hypothetical protein
MWKNGNFQTFPNNIYQPLLAELTNSVALVCERTIPTSDRCLSARLVPTFADRGVLHGQCGGSPTAVIAQNS